MREHSPPHVQVKAAGGIRTLDQLLEARPFITRCGASKTAEILNECRQRLGLQPISTTTQASGLAGSY
jgi:deoxyribose-phosphate aldolase